ncbi:MAG: ANTH domain-containing protein [Piptocephalis tieghemiana]|nr:MAG: ANTH domain-containing protein [Piptocephalis tieghemiana]
MDKPFHKATSKKLVPPKRKHVDTLVNATWSREVAMSELFELVAQRLNDPNWAIMLKTLVVTHCLMREGNLDRVMGYLCSIPTPFLDLGRYQGHLASHMRAYGGYLRSKIRAYKEIKLDFVRSYAGTSSAQQAQNPRMSFHPGVATPKPTGRLRRLSMEKGLLLEISVVQSQIDAILPCRVFPERMDNAICLSAFALIIRDLLRLFQALSEGIIHLLEQYFELDREKAIEALEVYRTFARQTEGVMSLLDAARRIQHELNLVVPTVQHPPLSLTNALQDYLDDPDFEANRAAYQRRRALGGRDVAGPVPPSPRTARMQDMGVTRGASLRHARSTPDLQASGGVPVQDPSSSSSTAVVPFQAPDNAPPAIIDFFASIEEEQRYLNANPSLASTNPFAPGPAPVSYRPLSAANPFIPEMQLNAQPLRNPFSPQLALPAPSPSSLSPYGGNPFAPSSQRTLRPARSMSIMGPVVMSSSASEVPGNGQLVPYNPPSPSSSSSSSFSSTYSSTISPTNPFASSVTSTTSFSSYSTPSSNPLLDDLFFDPSSSSHTTINASSSSSFSTTAANSLGSPHHRPFIPASQPGQVSGAQVGTPGAMGAFDSAFSNKDPRVVRFQ